MPRHQPKEEAAMNTLIEPEATDPPEGRRDDGLDRFRGDGKGLMRSLLPIFAGSIAVGVAIVAVVGVRLSRR
jgi:hypothetical protein